MTPVTFQKLAWKLARRQHWVITHIQLIEIGLTEDAIRWRIAAGRIHRIHRGIYAVGRPELTQEGRWMAAVLRCGREAVLSHESAARLWRFLNERRRGGAPEPTIHVSLPAAVFRQAPGIRVHRTITLSADDQTTHRGIPITTPTRTLIDLATILPAKRLEAAINEACVLDLTDPESLRAELAERKGQRGVRALRTLLDRHTFRLTESELERRFLRIVHKAGLALPDTQIQVAGRVDFHWPHLGLVVETDGWRYHRTPAQQARDNRRMQAHAADGRTAARFSHYEVRYEEARVAETLAALNARLSSTRPSASAAPSGP